MTTPQPPPIFTRGLRKEFGPVEAVRGVDLYVPRGEFFGFLGPNGAGKTTTIQMLTGLIRPSGGQAQVCGADPSIDPLHVKRRIGYLPEEIRTYERLTGREILRLAGSLHGLSRPSIAQRAEELLSLVALSNEDADRLIVDYSLGMKKKIGLASALIHGPELLFLDEPLGGIDALSARSIRETLVRLTRGGVTIFFSSHVLEIVEKICTRIAVISSGRIVAQGTIPEIVRASGEPEGASLEDAFVALLAIDPTDTTASLDWYTS